ncbi:hypothetical protein FHS14_005379 [Paenibacillus baekrokdamisoli]|nr:hypothetical protein [Paenibacillus baekrokdamisoli]
MGIMCSSEINIEVRVNSTRNLSANDLGLTQGEVVRICFSDDERIARCQSTKRSISISGICCGNTTVTANVVGGAEARFICVRVNVR